MKSVQKQVRKPVQKQIGKQVRLLMAVACLAAIGTMGTYGLVAQAEEIDSPIAAKHLLPQVAERGTRMQAKDLLDKATAAYKKQGKAVFAQFDKRPSQYSHRDLYVFVLGTDGVLKATSNNPEALVGKNVLEVRDAAGYRIFNEMLEATSASATGEVSYVWRNPDTNKVENKTALLQKVDGVILGVGYYLPRATKELAHAFLDSALAEMKEVGPEKAYAKFNDTNGSYVRNDLYVFAIGLDDAKYRAYGQNPKRVGEYVGEMRDAAGTSIVAKMIEIAKTKGSGTLDYVWRNPVTNKVEKKTSYIQREGDALIGVGYYQ
ncbi:cache domain-containing protein [Ampullimonas aquatilis]|uniref:cache domain-containing protein n=1 Tax=Ampullimonas aquatilis TaxID=1341549 RepID=UPI003C72BBD7